MPFIEERHETGHIELNLFGRCGATKGNRIINPSLLNEGGSQECQEEGQIHIITRIDSVPRVSVVDTVVGEVLPIDTDTGERRPLLE